MICHWVKVRHLLESTSSFFFSVNFSKAISGHGTVTDHSWHVPLVGEEEEEGEGVRGRGRGRGREGARGRERGRGEGDRFRRRPGGGRGMWEEEEGDSWLMKARKDAVWLCARKNTTGTH